MLPALPYALLKPALFRLDPESAHELMLDALAQWGRKPFFRALYAQPLVQDPVRIAGLDFANRVGLAAGLDKNARAIDGLGAMGFGFIEVGTVTPLAQPGNPKPRMFRLPQAEALINRLGFNNAGLDAFVEHVQQAHYHRRSEQRGILGLNIGKNASTPIASAHSDYLTCLRVVYPHADYIAVNISSPNTQNLRDLQSDAALQHLLGVLHEERLALEMQHKKRVPIFVKIAPDLSKDQVSAMADIVQSQHMDGIIATNTTLARDAVAHLKHGAETGGLSGKPVFAASNAVIAQLRSQLGPGFPIIGVGGILSGDDAVAKIKAGADLVQIYTGLIYQGPALVHAAAEAVRQCFAQ